MTGVWLLVGVLVLVVLLGLLLRLREGRVRTRRAAASTAVPAELRAELTGDRIGAAEVTLVQLSTAHCAPCRQARAVLGRFVAGHDRLAHLEVDLTDRTALTRELRVLRTPTTLGVDARGRELFRVSGVPREAELTEALRAHLSAPMGGSQQADSTPE